MSAAAASAGADTARACHMSHNSTQAPQGPSVSVPDSLEGLLAKPGSRFPSPEMVSSAVALFDRVARWDGTDAGDAQPVAAPWAAAPWSSTRAESIEDGVHAGSRSRYGVDGWAGAHRFRITVSPGSVQVSRRDVGKEQATLERAAISARANADQRAADLSTVGLAGFATSDGAPRSIIEEWSRKSRANMVKTYAQLDYRPLFEQGGTPAMVTLTLPGDWTAVAPTAEDYRKRVEVFRKRWERFWIGKHEGPAPAGKRFQRYGVLAATWKREFQRRGAPHTHLFVAVPEASALSPAALEQLREEVQPYVYGPLPYVPPFVSKLERRRVDLARSLGEPVLPEVVPFNFAEWLSGTWAEVVGHPDWFEWTKHYRAGTGVDFAEGLRASDPQRLAVYFAKHGGDGGGGKEYQNEGPKEWAGQSLGRFWGYWGMDKALGAVDVDWDDWISASRIMRKHHAAKRLTKRVRVWHQRYSTETGEALYRFEVSPAGVVERVAVGRWRWARRRSVRRFSNGSGFVTANNGPDFASAIARAVTSDPPAPAPDLAQRLAAYKARIREGV